LETWERENMNWYKVSQTDLDSLYRRAIELNDISSTQSLVDEAAKRNGYIHEVYKGYYPRNIKTEKEFDIFERQKPFPTFDSNETDLSGIKGFFTSDEKVAKGFQFSMGTLGRFYLKIDKPLILNANQRFAGELQFEKSGKEFRDAVRSGKYDCILLKDTKDEGDVYVVLDSNKIKSANYITKGRDGKIVPLSKRFDINNPSFNY
jgi:hypothetical protein